MIFLHTGMKLVLAGIPVIAVLVNAESTSRFISAELSGKKIFKKEGDNLNLTWKYKINSLPPHGSKVIEFLFGELIHPGYISRKCVVVDEDGKVVKAKNCEAKYGYYKKTESNGIYHQSSVAIYNLTKSDMKKSYGIDIEMGIYRSPLEDWFELHSFVKARISHLSISRNTTVKQGDAVNITCRATGGPEPNVTLYNGTRLIMEGKGEAKQEIEAAAMQDAGQYHCVASNEDDGTPDKKSITLSVEDDRGLVFHPQHTFMVTALDFTSAHQRNVQRRIPAGAHCKSMQCKRSFNIVVSSPMFAVYICFCTAFLIKSRHQLMDSIHEHLGTSRGPGSSAVRFKEMFFSTHDYWIPPHLPMDLNHSFKEGSSLS